MFKISATLLISLALFVQSAHSQYNVSPYTRVPSPYAPAARYAPYAWYIQTPYSGGQWQTFDGGLYGSYGGYQPLAIRPYSGTNYANPPYMAPAHFSGAPFTLDGGVYSLGARKNLLSQKALARELLRGEITITHRADASGPVNYALGGQVHSIAPGETKQEPVESPTIIAFGSGSEKGDLRYTLRPGTYRFVVTDGGWDLKEVVKRKP